MKLCPEHRGEAKPKSPVFWGSCGALAVAAALRCGCPALGLAPRCPAGAHGGAVPYLPLPFLPFPAQPRGAARGHGITALQYLSLIIAVQGKVAWIYRPDFSHRRPVLSSFRFNHNKLIVAEL